ncbi:hypothetical protein DPMN_097402, partial [Dreissena polymorpha]
CKPWEMGGQNGKKMKECRQQGGKEVINGCRQGGGKEMEVLTRFHYSHIKKTSLQPDGHFFQWFGTIFKLSLHIIRTHFLTMFH